MSIGNDPSLWRYDSLEDALAANTQLIARLIRLGEEQSAAEQTVDVTENISMSEKA
jgi:hypothetical protein